MTQYSLGADYIWKEVGEKIVVLDLNSGKYFSLNDTGGTIWTALMEKVGVDEIVERVSKEFDVDTDTARTDTTQLIDELVQNGMLAAD